MNTIIYKFDKKIKLIYSTPIYESPEEEKDFNTDIWSVGCIFYLMLFGRQPFNLESGMKQNEVKKLLNK